ncbi:MAG: universal stress protein [Cellulomonadaceae bacterium]
MTIVVGYLATREGLEALKVATEEATRRGTSLQVVVSEKTSRMQPAQIAEREQQIADLRATLEQSPVEFDIRVMGESSDVADDLVGAAEATDADMIVIGLRRRSPVGKLILGSNAQRILLDAPCPVLAVKPASS